MERSFRDDLKWGLAVLAGAVLGYLIFGGDDVSLLVGSFAGVLAVICVFAGLRRMRRSRKG